MQKVFGREYSKLSRVLKAVWTFLDDTWSHLVTNNIEFFVNRFPNYNRCIKEEFNEIFPSTRFPER